MYVSALSTAGITDASIVVAAPFEVSGTAALSGVYKAYEDITGEVLDDTAKLISTQELTITGELAAEIGSLDSTMIVTELKKILNITKNMSDEQLREKIVEIASGINVTLNDNQINQLITLCRSFEKLDPDAMKARVEQVQQTIKNISEKANDVVSFLGKVMKFFGSVGDFFSKLAGLFSK